MDRDTEFFRALSAKYGMPLQFVIKEFHVMSLLEKIAARTEPLPIVFKGGTALNRGYSSGISRFSEDLDFDFASKMAIKKKISLLEDIMNIGGFDVKRSRLFRNRLRFDCFFENEMGVKDVVRAEFNMSLERLLGAVGKRAVISEISGKSIMGVKTYSLEYLLASKILALHGRTEGKDIFDLANFIEKADTRLVAKSLGDILLHGHGRKTAAAVISECVEKLERINTREVKALTNNYIPVQLRPNWDEIIATLKMRLVAIEKQASKSDDS